MCVTHARAPLRVVGEVLSAKLLGIWLLLEGQVTFGARLCVVALACLEKKERQNKTQDAYLWAAVKHGGAGTSSGSVAFCASPLPGVFQLYKLLHDCVYVCSRCARGDANTNKRGGAPDGVDNASLCRRLCFLASSSDVSCCGRSDSRDCRRCVAFSALAESSGISFSFGGGGTLCETPPCAAAGCCLRSVRALVGAARPGCQNPPFSFACSEACAGGAGASGPAAPAFSALKRSRRSA